MIGCSRNYVVNIKVKSTDLLGQWSLESAPSSVSKLLGTNASRSGFTLRSNGKAVLQFFPIENFEPSAPQLGSRWSVVSQECKWDLRDWGDHGRHVWKLELEIETKGIGLTVGKLSSGLCSTTLQIRTKTKLYYSKSLRVKGRTIDLKMVDPFPLSLGRGRTPLSAENNPDLSAFHCVLHAVSSRWWADRVHIFLAGHSSRGMPLMASLMNRVACSVEKVVATFGCPGGTS